MKYERIKGKAFGSCNICGEERKLTWDHVPPKSCGNSSTVIGHEALPFLTDPSSKAPLSQNGRKFRTICERCNNTVLGNWYDPELVNFSKAIRINLESLFHPRNTFRLKVKPNLIIKAAIGHLMASKKEQDWANFDTCGRDSLLTKDAPIPQNLECYYWVHPFEGFCSIRDAGITMNKKTDVIQQLAFYPLNITFTTEPLLNGIPKLSNWKQMNTEFEVTIPIQTHRHPPFGWPWHTDYSGMILGGKGFTQSAISYPYSSPKRAG